VTLDVLNGEARVAGNATIGGVPGTGSEILVDFRELGSGFTGKLFPTGNLVDAIAMDDGSSVDVTILDMANLCVFFDATSFGIGCTGLELRDQAAPRTPSLREETRTPSLREERWTSLVLSRNVKKTHLPRGSWLRL